MTQTKIHKTAVNSSAITHVEYEPGDGGRGTLTITFPSGEAYAYTGVPQAEHDALLAAESAGRYFATKIRGAYPHSKQARA